MPKRLDIPAGTKFGHLTVIEDGPTQRISNKPCRSLVCLCVCGKRHTVLLSSLRSGLSRSCGCHNGPISERGKNKPEDIEGATWFPLANNKWMLIDTADVPLFEGKRISVTKLGYAGWNARIDGKHTRVCVHRFIFGLSKNDGQYVDHKNRNKLDNRRSNLRLCTAWQNAANKVHKTNRLYRGVVKMGKKWWASISSQNNIVSLGSFSSAVDAAKAYDAAARKLHGEFAILNFPLEDGTNNED